MTDNEFLNAIKAANLAAKKHKRLAAKAAKEYKRRFGANPSDVDDDFWIDAVEYGNGGVSGLQPFIDSALFNTNKKP